MHCEACARKVRWSLKDFPGVEDVITDCKSHQVVVKGEKADPLKVLERVQKKNRRKVELLSPIPDTPQVEKPSQEVNPPEKEKKEEVIFSLISRSVYKIIVNYCNFKKITIILVKFNNTNCVHYVAK